MIFNEYALIGALLCRTRDEAEVYKSIEKDAFVDPLCAIIFDVMKTMFYNAEDIDIITVSDRIESKPDLMIQFRGNSVLAFVSSLPDQCPIVANALHYLKGVETAYVKRKISEASDRIASLVVEGGYESVLDLKNDSIKLLSDIRISDEKGMGSSFLDVLDTCVNNIISKRLISKEDEEKLYTGYEYFDMMTDGFHKQELTIIGARPAVGKTQFALALTKKLAERHNKIIFFSREMGDVTLGNRFLSNMTGIEGHRLRRAKCLSQEEMQLIVDTKENIKKLRELNIIFNTTASTIQEIRSVIREAFLKKELDVVVIDYLMLLQSANHHGDRRAEVEYISRQLKLMTIEFNIPILCLSQLSRSSARENREPELFDLRETGQIEADADNVLFLHIPPWITDVNTPFLMKVIIAKQRNGATSNVWLWNDRTRMNMYDPTKEEIDYAISMDMNPNSI